MGRVLLVLLLVLLTTGGFAQTAVEPAWLFVERAEQLIESRDFGRAIQLLREADQVEPDRAETIYALGRVYRAINDFDVAEQYFEESLGLQFEAPDTRFLVLTDLAGIYRTRRDYARFETTLEEIVRLDTLPEGFVVPDDPDDVLADLGMDRFLVLYRLPESGGTRGRSELGELLVGLGRYAQASETLAIPVLQAMTTLIDRAREIDPTYEFREVSGLFAKVSDDERAQFYLSESDLFHDLYYLGAAYQGSGNSYARAVWSLLAAHDERGEWGQRAARQLRDPRPEPALIPRR